MVFLVLAVVVILCAPAVAILTGLWHDPAPDHQLNLWRFWIAVTILVVGSVAGIANAYLEFETAGNERLDGYMAGRTDVTERR